MPCLQVGLPALAGNREHLPPIEGWAGRARRAHRNMLENLALFASLVLVAQVAGKANATTALGAELFFWARLIYAPVYVVGIPFLRTAAWLVSVVGLVMIFLQLVCRICRSLWRRRLVGASVCSDASVV